MSRSIAIALMLLWGCGGGSRTAPKNPEEPTPHWIPSSPLPSLKIERSPPPQAPVAPAPGEEPGEGEEVPGEAPQQPTQEEGLDANP